MHEKTPLFIGLRAARANLLPGLVIQAAMIALVLAYYYYPPATAWFEKLAIAKQNYGFLFTMIAVFIAGAVLPQLLSVLILQRGKITTENLRDFYFLAIFWPLDGVILDVFYRMQTIWFGPQIDFPTIAKKVLVDQLLWNPLFAAPVGLFFYEWKNQRYSAAGMSRTLTWQFYKNKTIPALFATWVIWFPVTGAIYSLPPLLQIPLFSLALTFWVMMFAYITSASNRRPAAIVPAVQEA